MIFKVRAERHEDTIIIQCPHCNRRQYLDDTYDISGTRVFPDFVCMAHSKNYSIDPVSKTICPFSDKIQLDFI